MAAASTGSRAEEKKRILIFCDYYLPSSKAGGGMWTIANLIERFSDRYDFYVVSRNHESRTDTRAFQTVESNAWNDVGNARVFYLAPNRITISMVGALIREVSPDGIFLNSLFSKPVVTFLTLRRIRRSIKAPVILAPCGELSEGALGLKRWKKRIFLTMANIIQLYSGIDWKATSQLESEEIRRTFGANQIPWVAPDLPPKQILPDFSSVDKPLKEPGKAKFIYYSRIDQKKNLMFVLDILPKAISNGTAELTIAGPIDDEAYWRKCREKIAQLPRSISVRGVGPVSHEDGLKLLVSNHFLILPTLGENFGYVILEALAAGCPVLTSDRTIWTEIADQKAGWTSSLNDSSNWKLNIDRCVAMDSDEYESMSTTSRNIAIEWLRSPDVVLATEKVLAEVIGV
jgi:glycosyltransferase involved in cell wall biosynthesis